MNSLDIGVMVKEQNNIKTFFTKNGVLENAVAKNLSTLFGVNTQNQQSDQISWFQWWPSDWNGRESLANWKKNSSKGSVFNLQCYLSYLNIVQTCCRKIRSFKSIYVYRFKSLKLCKNWIFYSFYSCYN